MVGQRIARSREGVTAGQVLTSLDIKAIRNPGPEQARCRKGLESHLSEAQICLAVMPCQRVRVLHPAYGVPYP
jgi:hypothetical protein